MSRFLAWCRKRPWTWAVVAGVACGAAGYGAGRFAAPTKVETTATTDTQTHAEEHTAVDEHREEGPVRVVTVTRWRPAPTPAGPPPPPGCPDCPPVLEQTRTEERGPVTVDTHAAATSSLDQATHEVVEKIVERDAPRLTVFATVGAGFSSSGLSPPAYGAGVAYRVAGPVTVVVQGEGNAQGGSARAGVGLTF